MFVSVVIPVHNEYDSIKELNHRLHYSLKSYKSISKYQLIYVDDGSTDSSNNLLREITNEIDSKLITLRANFGKSMALLAGFLEAKGDYVVSIDSDLQDYPEDIPNLIKCLKDNDCDVVCGWRSNRKDTLAKRFVSGLYNRTIKILTGLKIHDHNCGLKLYRKKVILQLSVYGQLHRYLALQAHLSKFKVVECRVQNAPRLYGESKYPTIRYEGIFDLISILLAANARFTPSHFFGLISSVPFIGSFLIMLYLLTYHAFAIILGNPAFLITSRPLFVIAVFLLLASIQILTAGLVCDFYLSKVMQSNPNKTLSYILKEDD